MNKTKINNMRLTFRDLDLLQWINSVGFVTIEHIAFKLQIAKPTAYIRARKLVLRGYLLYEQIFHRANGTYRLTNEGVKVSGSNMPVLRKISLATYHHDIKVTTLSLRLAGHFDGEYIPERELRHIDGIGTFGKTGHIPDSVFILKDKKIAIELELSKKGRRRRDRIFNYYLKNFNYQEVWYFCGNEEIMRQINPFLKKAHFIKSYLIHSFFNHQEKIDGKPNKIEPIEFT